MWLEASIYCLLCLKKAVIRTHHPLHKLLISVMAPLKHFGLAEVTIIASYSCVKRRYKKVTSWWYDWFGRNVHQCASFHNVLVVLFTLYWTVICYITITVTRLRQLRLKVSLAVTYTASLGNDYIILWANKLITLSRPTQTALFQSTEFKKGTKCRF